MANEFKFILPHIMEVANYTPPLFEKNVCGLYMNYSLYGPSPNCIKALQGIEGKDFFEYAYGGNLMINKALANHLNVLEDMVLVDHGAANVINMIFRAVLDKGDHVLVPSPGWEYYRSAAILSGANWAEYKVFEKDDRFVYCEDEILNRLNETKSKLLVITSPNMPTGNMITQAQLELIADTAKDTLILVDEAYYGFTSEYNIDISYLTKNYSNIVFVRTLSKLYGLASERIGFSITNTKLISILKKMAPLFGISYTSQLIAEAALKDIKYYETISKYTISSREQLAAELTKLGSYSVYKSEGNFLLVKLLKHSADELVKFFFTNGYAIRNCQKGYNLNSHIRISIGTNLITEHVIKLFKEFEKINNCQNLSAASKGIVTNDGDDFGF